MLEISLTRCAPSKLKPVALREALDRALSSGASGFPDLPQRGALWQDSLRVGQDLRRRFETLVVVGIGGSSLGAQVVADLAVSTRLRFLDNVDAVAFQRLLLQLGDLQKVGFLFVSKSGNTIETLASLAYLKEVFSAKGLKLEDASHVMTESEENELGRWAKSSGVPLTLLPKDVGGRFSVLSPVGMVPAAFDGRDVEAFRRGASRALSEGRETVIHLMDQVLASYSREEWITLFWFYCSSMKTFGAWLVQLWAESLGKRRDRRGGDAPRVSTPMTAIGAVDQHSFLQQVMEGTRDKFVIFLRVEASEGGELRLRQAPFQDCQGLVGAGLGKLLKAEALATEEALATNGISTLSLRTSVLDEESLGFLFMSFQMLIAGLCEVLDLNAYDQPGVELGKSLARRQLS